MLKVLFESSSEFVSLPKEEFAERMGVAWTDHLVFQTRAFEEKILKESKKALRRKDLTIREKWISVRFQKEVSEGYLPKVSVRYIDEALGYGVFAEEKISAGAFIGEYTGLIRKRKRRADRKNDYCYEYTIGDWSLNPFIIDAKDHGNVTRWINHSEDPNVESLSVCVEGIMHIILLALKPIEAGSQLCYHYGDTFWKKRRHQEKRIVTGS